MSVPAGRIRLDTASTNVTNSAWVELEDLLPDHISAIDVANGGGQDIVLGIGAAGAEQNLLYIKASSLYQKMDISLPKDIRLSVKSLGSTISTGTIVINLWS